MRPLIKWPGGKSREYKTIKQHIPTHKRYFEPFFGGGAIGFKLEPIQAYVNDIDTKLIDFYRKTKAQNREFLTELDKIDHDWQLIERIAILLNETYLAAFPQSLEELETIDIKADVATLLDRSLAAIENELSGMQRVAVSEYLDYLRGSILDKSGRVVKLQMKHEVIFDEELMRDHLMTAIKAAYYTQLRDIFNSDCTAAVFYYIREFCYGSMFRFNSKGEFNIPYGGINYNHKDISSKFDRLTKQKVRRVLGQFDFYNEDFEEFFSRFDLSTKDFIFLDPPYDSNFKNYGKNPFYEEDQTRLAEFLANCQAQWLLVIKKTKLIWDLYSSIAEKNESVSIFAYDKTYTYNVRGRNDRDVSHLLIKNF